MVYMDTKFRCWDLKKTLSQDVADQFVDIMNSVGFMYLNVMKTNVLLNIAHFKDPTKTPNIIERFIYDTAEYHLSHMNRTFDENTFVEFWINYHDMKHYNHKNMHIDCDEYDRQANRNDNYPTPLLSCVTYFNDYVTAPTVITNVDREMYKYKDFSEKNGIHLCFPQKMRQITFDGGKYYHGKSRMFGEIETDEKRCIIAINIWDKRPTLVPYFDYEQFLFIYGTRHNKPFPNIPFDLKSTVFTPCEVTDNVKHIELPESVKILSPAFFEKILYRGIESVDMKPFEHFIDTSSIDTINAFTFVNTVTKVAVVEPVANLNTASEAIQQTINKEYLKQMTVIDISEGRFAQRFTYPGVFTKEICRWIVVEAESYASANGGWTTTRHKNYPTTDIPLERITNVFRFILSSFFESVKQKITKSYCLSEKYVYDIRDIFIVKYENRDGAQNALDMHVDGSVVTASIMLSDPSEFTGGGTFYEDGISAHLDQGDMIIHTKQHRHSGLKTTSGLRYVLVFFIDILEAK